MRYRRKCWLLLIPSLAGILVFYMIPFIRVLYYSMIENQFTRKWVGFDNYINVLTNEYFQLAFKNTVILILIGVPMVTVLAFLLADLCNTLSGKYSLAVGLFILPMLIPTASIVQVWHEIWGRSDSVIPIYTIFIWKNTGMGFILFRASFAQLERSMFEAAALDGAVGWKSRVYMLYPAMFQIIFFVILLEIVNSFRIFRESYLYYGTEYPEASGYTLQYYMNNHFLKLNYQNMASGAIITLVFIMLIIVIGVKLQNRFKEG